MPRWNVHFDMSLDHRSAELMALIDTVHANAKLISRLPLPPVAEAKLNSLNIVRAVVGTTGIEGADLTTDEVTEILQSPETQVLPPSREREEMEARNAHAVMKFVEETPETEITEPLIRQIHRLTTQSIEYDNNEPGLYRSHPAHAGDYLPPQTNDEVRRLMGQFVSWINSGERRGWDCLIKAVVSHFYLVSIHPFGDGNGRTSRAVESFVLFKGGVNVRGFYSLSNYYYRNRAEYIRILDYTRFRSNDDLTPLALFALRGLKEELDWVSDQVVRYMRLIAFRDYAREQIFEPDSPATLAVAQRQFSLTGAVPEKGMSTPDLIDFVRAYLPEYRKVGERSVRRDIANLIALQVLKLEHNKVAPNLGVMDRFARSQTRAKP